MAIRTIGAFCASFLSLLTPHHEGPHGVTIALDDAAPYRAHHEPWRSPLSPHDQLVYVLTQNLWGECRGAKDRNGCYMDVASVHLNRAKANLPGRYGSGLRGVIEHPYAFSCRNENDPGREMMRRIALGLVPKSSPDFISWVQAKGVARMAVNGHLSDTVHRATFYRTRAVKPAWLREVRLVVSGRDHDYYVLRRG